MTSTLFWPGYRELIDSFMASTTIAPRLVETMKPAMDMHIRLPGRIILLLHAT